MKYKRIIFIALVFINLSLLSACDRSSAPILLEHPHIAQAITYSPDGTILASGDLGGSIFLWNTKTGKKIKTLSGHKKNPAGLYSFSLAFSPDGAVLASGSNSDENIRFWEIPSGEFQRSIVNTFNGKKSSVDALAFSPDGRTLAVAGYSVDLIDLATSQKIWTYLDNRRDSALELAFSPDNKILAVAHKGGTIVFLDVTTGSEIRKFIHNTEINQIRSIAFHPESRLFAAAGSRYSPDVKLWDVQSGRLEKTFTGRLYESYEHLCVDFSPDGTTLAFSTRSDSITLWDLLLEMEIGKVTWSGKNIKKIKFSPDGEHIALQSRHIKIVPIESVIE